MIFMKKTIVCIFAHPDDESFGPAGTIAKYAKTNDVYLLCATKGEAGEKNIEDRRKLGEIRAEELTNSAKILGIKKVYFLGFEDGTLCNNLYHKLADKIREKLEELKPEVVMTYEPKGVSGHIDHITVGMVTMFVSRKLSFIKTILQYCTLKKYSKFRKDYFIYFPPGYHLSEIDKIVDTKDVWEIKVKAMNAHKSQIHDIKRVLSMQKKMPKREYFLILKNK